MTDPAALLRHVLAELTQIGRDVRTLHDLAAMSEQTAKADLAQSALARIASLISAVVAPTEQAAVVTCATCLGRGAVMFSGVHQPCPTCLLVAEQAAPVDNGVLATVNARLAELAERVERLEGERRERMLRRAQAEAHEAHDHGY